MTSATKERLNSVVEIFGCTTLKWVLPMDATHYVKEEVSRSLRTLLDAYIHAKEDYIFLIEDAKILLLIAGEHGESARDLADRLYWFISLLESEIESGSNLKSAA